MIYIYDIEKLSYLYMILNHCNFFINTPYKDKILYMKNITTKLYSKSPGIYKIINTKTGYVYVGSTVNLYRRLIHHRAELEQNRHCNSHLQNSFNLHGIDNFKIEILENCRRDQRQLYERECFYCKKEPKTFNTRTIESLSFGFTRTISEESRKKQSLKLKGKIPKNLSDIQKIHRRKIGKFIEGNLVEIFESCKLAADSIGMKPNCFHQYIGMKLGKKGSKYFKTNVKYEYI